MADEIKQVVKIEASLTQIQSQLKTLEGNFASSFSKISSVANSALGALGVGLSAGAIVAFGREVLNLADTLQNLHEQTGLSIELLSGFKSTLEESGTSLDAFARGVFNLQKNLGNVDKETDPAAQAIKRLGLNLNELRNSSPDEFIQKVTDALAQIQNPVERNTLLFNLLGKSAKELGPAFQQLIGRFQELKANGLSAADVKAIDDVGDALTRLKNQALALGAEGAAGLLRFFGIIRDAPKLGSDLAKATERFAQLTNTPKERVEGMTSREIIAKAEIPTKFADNPQALRMARDELLNLREEFDRVNASARTIPSAPFKGFGASAKEAKKETSELGNFLDGLEKQLAALEIKNIELKLGPDAGLAKSLDAQLAAFKQNLQDAQKPIPKGLDQFFTVLKDKILAANEELKRTQVEMQRIEELAKMLNQDSAEWLTVTEDLAKNAADALEKLEPKFRELQRSLAIEILPPDQQGAAQAVQEFEDRVKAINEWREALIRANGDVETANREAAQATADAWAASQQKIKDQAEETNEFVRRAFERGFDAVADAITDVLDGQIRSVEEFGERVRKALNSIAADFLTLQAKELLLGKDFGKAGGSVGGILGDLFGTKKAPAEKIQGTTAADVLDAERGQELIAAAQAAISTGAATAETSIAAISAQAQTSLQTSATLAQAGITATETAAVSGISAVQAVAIAAIEAAAAASSGGGAGGLGALGSLFGSGGGGDVFAGGATGFEAGFFHSGGVVGQTSVPTRMVPSSVFRSAMRFHRGGMIGPDEVPIIAQKGEMILPRGARMGTPVTIVQNFPNATNPEGFRQNRATYLSDISRAVKKGQRYE